MKKKMKNLFILFFLICFAGCLKKSEFDQYHSPYYDIPWNFSISSFSATTNSVTLNWQNSQNARTYSVKYKDQMDSDFTTQSTSATSGYTVTGLSLGHTYFFKVEGIGVSGSNESNTVTLTMTNPPVASAMSLSMNIGATQTVTLLYSDVDGDLASSCSVDSSSLDGVAISSACSCSAGICIVGIRENRGIAGNASFKFTVTSNHQTSNQALADVSVFP